MGGTSDKRIAFGLENLVCLCRECHNWVHANPNAAYESGFLVRLGVNPADVPIVKGEVCEFLPHFFSSWDSIDFS